VNGQLVRAGLVPLLQRLEVLGLAVEAEGVQGLVLELWFGVTQCVHLAKGYINKGGKVLVEWEKNGSVLLGADGHPGFLDQDAAGFEDQVSQNRLLVLDLLAPLA
jgi:hypothetical protein